MLSFIIVGYVSQVLGRGLFEKEGGRPVLNRVNELMLMILPSESSKILVKHEVATVKVLT